MLRSTAWAIALFLAVSPAAAETSQGVQVAYAWVVTGLPGFTVSRPSDPTGNVAPKRPITLDLPTPVPLTYLDFGAYEPYAPQLTERINQRPDMRSLAGGGDLNDPKLWLSGNEWRTVVGTSIVHTQGPTAVRARAGIIIPGIPTMGEPTPLFLRASDLKLDVRYKF
jgi:hypothetical protein